MLRNSFLKSLLNEGKNSNDYKYANEDENYILKINRPLSEKSIVDLPSNNALLRGLLDYGNGGPGNITLGP